MATRITLGREGLFDQRQRSIPLGRVVATASAIATLDDGSIRAALARHASGDWGDLDEHDRAVNEDALRSEDRVFSVYRDQSGTRFYVITEPDRRVTTVLLPEEY